MALGELAALADAVCWAGTGVATKRLGRNVRPVHVTALLAGVSTVALVLISIATGQAGDVLRTPAWSFALFAAGAVAGAAGMLLFFVTISLSSVGVTYTTTSGLYILFSLVVGVLFLDDRAGAWTIAGAGAIVAGLYVLNSRPVAAAKGAPSGGAEDAANAGEIVSTGRTAYMRLGLPAGTAAALGLGAITAALWAADLTASAKGLERAGPLANGLVHQVIPAAVFGAFIIASPRLRSQRVAPPDQRRLVFAGALYIGSTLSWNYALANTDAGVTALLASTSPVFALIFGSLLLRERLTRTALAGAGLAFAGIVAVVVSR